MDPKITELENEIAILRETVHILEVKLEKYTNNDRHKKYYEKNKDRIKENARQYLLKLKEENPEKLKEYRRRAYENRKDRVQT